jgi:SAM-dependent methyltransferase
MVAHRKQAIRAHYEPRLRSGLASHAVLDWRSRAGQLARIRALCRNVDLAGRRVLDLGCGLGDLYAHLKACGIGCDYTGVDLLEEMVVAARRRHPGARFLCADVFAGDVFAPAAFDVVFASGVFNLDLGNNEAFLAAAIPRLRRLARECVVFNLLHRRSPEREPGYYYYDPARVVGMLRAGGCRVELLDDYLPEDFTVLCHTGRAARRGSCDACTLARCEVRPC